MILQNFLHIFLKINYKYFQTAVQVKGLVLPTATFELLSTVQVVNSCNTAAHIRRNCVSGKGIS